MQAPGTQEDIGAEGGTSRDSIPYPGVLPGTTRAITVLRSAEYSRGAEIMNPPPPPPPSLLSLQVPGCEPDAKDMKVYNIRNKVCNVHLGMAEVDIDGAMMRFCRQCARFQPTTEFDGLKRSCRQRLEKHNERYVK